MKGYLRNLPAEKIEGKLRGCFVRYVNLCRLSEVEDCFVDTIWTTKEVEADRVSYLLTRSKSKFNYFWCFSASCYVVYDLISTYHCGMFNYVMCTEEMLPYILNTRWKGEPHRIVLVKEARKYTINKVHACVSESLNSSTLEQFVPNSTIYIGKEVYRC